MLIIKEKVLKELDLLEQDLLSFKKKIILNNNKKDIEIDFLKSHINELESKNSKASQLIEKSISILKNLK